MLPCVLLSLRKGLEPQPQHLYPRRTPHLLQAYVRYRALIVNQNSWKNQVHILIMLFTMSVSHVLKICIAQVSCALETSARILLIRKHIHTCEFPASTGKLPACWNLPALCITDEEGFEPSCPDLESGRLTIILFVHIIPKVCCYAKRGFVLTNYGVTLHNSLHLTLWLKNHTIDLKPYSLDDGCF